MSRSETWCTTATTLVLMAALTACGTDLSQNEISSEEARNLVVYPHTLLDDTLERHVDAHGRVDYAALAKERQNLDYFTATVAAVGPETRPDLFATDEAKFAYAINAYNSLVLINVLARYPELETLEGTKVDFFYLTDVKIDGKQTSLYALEHDMIRPAMRAHYIARSQGSKFGRVHFVLNCASSSCPMLPNRAFTPEGLEDELGRETRKFLMEPRNVSVDDAARVVTLSELFDWYAVDFIDDKGKVIEPLEWINLYRPEGEKLDTSMAVEFRPYDWTLNDPDLVR